VIVTFSIGEMKELFYSVRAYEIARAHDVKHYVFANSDYALRKAGWDEQYHWGHNDAKGRVGDFILSHGQATMKTSLFTTPPYMDMLHDGMLVPKEQGDGSFVWESPACKWYRSQEWRKKRQLISGKPMGKYR
jgi:hypothetical protein